MGRAHRRGTPAVSVTLPSGRPCHPEITISASNSIDCSQLVRSFRHGADTTCCTPAAAKASPSRAISVACQVYGTTPLPQARDHVGGLEPVGVMIPAGSLAVKHQERFTPA